MKQKNITQSGMITPLILVILAVFSVLATSIMSWTIQERRSVLSESHKTKALQVAEAGIDYYRWHLSHAESDYKDGRNWCCNNNASSTPATCGGSCGPYISVYYDYDGKAIGEYSLKITPAIVGSTIVQVESSGLTYEDLATAKTIATSLGKKTLARYSLFTDTDLSWGDNDVATPGPIHSNSGINFNGPCAAEVSSSVLRYMWGYYDEDWNEIFVEKDGIWGESPTECKKFWSMDVPPVDFEGFTVDMVNIKNAATTGGIYLKHLTGNWSERQAAISRGEDVSLSYYGVGYKLVFRPDAKVDIYVVRSLGGPMVYYDDGSDAEFCATGYERPELFPIFYGTYNMPANGLVFAKDDVWVEGTVKGRVTVAASNLGNINYGLALITINDSIVYAPGSGGARDGSSVLGLMSEGDILIPFKSPDSLEIDGMMLSQKGHVYKRSYCYDDDNHEPHDTPELITIYGGVITKKFSAWGYTDGGEIVDGYLTANQPYDSHMLYSPPPSFPTEKNYEILSWSEKK